MLIILCFCCAFPKLAAIAENVPRPASTRKTPARRINKAIKTRKLKKADREVDFFFMGGFDVDGILVRSALLAEPPTPRQHFFQFCRVIPLSFCWMQNAWQVLVQFFEQRLIWTARIRSRNRNSALYYLAQVRHTDGSIRSADSRSARSVFVLPFEVTPQLKAMRGRVGRLPR